MNNPGVEHGQDSQRERQGEDSAEADNNTHRHPETRMRNDHRQHTQRRGSRGEEHRSHTSASRLVGSLAYTQSARMAKLLGVLVHHDSITHNDTDERHRTQHRRDGYIQAEQPQP